MKSLAAPWQRLAHLRKSRTSGSWLTSRLYGLDCWSWLVGAVTGMVMFARTKRVQVDKYWICSTSLHVDKGTQCLRTHEIVARFVIKGANQCLTLSMNSHLP